jgi:Cu/Ag efflux protein CusF
MKLQMKSMTQAVLLGVFLGVASLQAGADSGAKADVSAIAQDRTVAIVEAVDLETRELVLRTEDGEEVRFVAGDEVRNLEQVEVGDRVVVEATVGLVMMMSPASDAEASRTDMLEVWRSELGQRPGGLIQHTVLATGTVTELDRDARTVTVQGPEATLTLPLADHVDVDSIHVGDEVNALYQESIAISVEPAPGEE